MTTGLSPQIDRCLFHFNSVKESIYTKDEIKDVMAHLNFKMKETTAAQQPLDVRILKYLLVKTHTPLAFLLTTLHGALGRPPSRLHSQERSPYRGLHFRRENVCVFPRSRAVFCRPVCQTQFTAQFIRTKCITGHEKERERERESKS